jgi:hypothetical protein
MRVVAVMLKRILPIVSIGALSAIGIAVTSTEAQAQSTFDSAIVQPKFAPDPMQLKGVTGGQSAAGLPALSPNRAKIPLPLSQHHRQ